MGPDRGSFAQKLSGGGGPGKKRRLKPPGGDLSPAFVLALPYTVGRGARRQSGLAYCRSTVPLGLRGRVSRPIPATWVLPYGAGRYWNVRLQKRLNERSYEVDGMKSYCINNKIGTDPASLI